MVENTKHLAVTSFKGQHALGLDYHLISRCNNYCAVVFFMEKGGHHPSRVTFSERLHEKKVDPFTQIRAFAQALIYQVNLARQAEVYTYGEKLADH